jgi:zinc protease
VTPAELESGRRARIGLLAVRIDGPDSIATRLAELSRDGLPPDFLDHYAAGVQAVTPADVSTAAARYLNPDHLVIVVTGDRKVIEPALRAANLAPIVILDASGNPVP